MPLFHTTGFKKTELNKLNKCRIYLKVITVADITSGDGRTICGQSLNGIRDPHRPRRFKWPIQSLPQRSSWTLWKKAIFQTLSCTELHPVLPTKLGKWYCRDFWDLWPWFYEPYEDHIYRSGGQFGRVYKRKYSGRLRHHRPIYTESHLTLSIPLSSQP